MESKQQRIWNKINDNINSIHNIHFRIASKIALTSFRARECNIVSIERKSLHPEDFFTYWVIYSDRTDNVFIVNLINTNDKSLSDSKFFETLKEARNFLY